MDNKIKYVIGVGAVLLVALTVWAVVTSPQPPEEPSEKKEVTMEYGRSTIREEKDGRLLWELTADVLQTEAKAQTVDLKNVAAKYYRSDGVTITLTAPKGRYIPGTQEVSLTGGVKGNTSDEMTLESDSLDWKAEEDRLTATGNAKITKPGMEATGDMIEASENFTDFTVKGNAKIVRK